MRGIEILERFRHPKHPDYLEKVLFHKYEYFKEFGVFKNIPHSSLIVHAKHFKVTRASKKLNHSLSGQKNIPEDIERLINLYM